MLRLCFTLFVLLFYSFFVGAVTNLTIGHSIPLSYILLAFLMFFISMITKVSNFKYFVLLSILLMSIALIIFNKKGKIKFKEALNKFLKPSLLIYVVFFIYLYFVIGKIQLSNIDDLGYWGTRVLDINRTDALYTKEYTVFSNFSYPPFTALIEIVFVKLFGTFNQSYLILAQASFCFSLLLNVFDKYDCNLKSILKIIITLLIIICATLMIQNNKSFGDQAYIYNSIYVDWLIGMLLGKCLSLLYKFDIENKYSYIELGLFESSLILVKPTAIPLVVLIVVCTYVYLTLNEKRLFLNKNKLVNYILYVLGLPLIIYFVWKVYFSIYSSNKSQISGTMICMLIGTVLAVVLITIVCGLIYKKHKNKIKLKFLFGICMFLPAVIYALVLVINPSFFKGNDNYYLSILVRFIDTYFGGQIFTHPFTMSYYFITILVTIALLAIGNARKKENSFYSIPVLYYFGSIGYALMILLSYMFVFNYEGYTLVVFGRYMQTYTYAGVVLLILVILEEELNCLALGGVAVISMLFVEPDSVSTIIYNNNWENYRSEAQIEAIDNYFEYEYNYENMAVFAQYDMRDLSLIGYLADEKKTNIKYYEAITSEDEERFDEAIKNNDYAFVGTRDDVLVSLWSKYSDEEPYNMSLYKINHDGDDTTIELVYTWDDLR